MFNALGERNELSGCFATIREVDNHEGGATHIAFPIQPNNASCEEPILPIIGEVSVGKTAIVRRFVDDSYPSQYESTIGGQYIRMLFSSEPAINPLRIKLT